MMDDHMGLGEVAQEMDRQYDKWGEQNHPMCDEYNSESGYARLAEIYKAANDALATKGTISWDGILLEEVFEAFAEINPKDQYDEMNQVAAVAETIKECLRRNNPEVDFG
jgi:hypothetical protein